MYKVVLYLNLFSIILILAYFSKPSTIIKILNCQLKVYPVYKIIQDVLQIVINFNVQYNTCCLYKITGREFMVNKHHTIAHSE